MRNDDDRRDPQDVQRAIARAADRTPAVQSLRQRLTRIGGDEDKALELLVQAIRRMLRDG